MIINHNMQAMNAGRQMGINSTNSSKNMEKLSSGLRINRAGDDAAGLSISEKMRGQIKGLNQASRNSQDGISLIQTAEGALDETHNILQRMRELAVQGANSTNVAEDRTAISEELNQLTKELDRIAGTTEFNKQSLLDGGFAGTFQIGANQGQTIDLSIGSMSSNALGISGGTKLNAVTIAAGSVGALASGDYTFVETTPGAGTGNLTDATGNVVGTVAADGKITAGGKEIDMGHKLNAGTTISIKGTSAQATLGKVESANPNHATNQMAAGDYTVSGTNLLLGDKLVGTVDSATGILTKADGTGTVDLTELGLIANATPADSDFGPGKSFTIQGIDVSNSSKATGSISTIETAISRVSEQRSKLGATQNRLEHTIKNLDNASENTQAAESRIRDVDMAKEMMEMSKNDILNQASQAMLAQAKQAPQAVLQLLR